MQPRLHLALFSAVPPALRREKTYDVAGGCSPGKFTPPVAFAHILTTNRHARRVTYPRHQPRLHQRMFRNE